MPLRSGKTKFYSSFHGFPLLILRSQVGTEFTRGISGGEKKRLSIGMEMIIDPKVMFLDEPTTGLDPNQIVEIRKLIKEIGQEKTVILSTHILPEVEATCDRILIILTIKKYGKNSLI